MKKIALALSICMLAACGESKVTKIDSSSVDAADQSFKAMMKGMKDDQYIQMSTDYRMIHSRYKGDDFLKAVGGKDIAGFNKEVADTKAYFIEQGRQRFIQKDQDEIDRLNTRIEKVSEIRRQMDPNFDPEQYAVTSQDLSKVRQLKQRQEDYKTQDSEEFWKEHGCGCYESKFKETIKAL